MKKTADPDSLPPTSPKTMAVLIVILLGLMAATFKVALYPSPPAAWARLHEPATLSVADANKLLSDSGAVIESIKSADSITTETWNMRHRTGQWTILVCFSKTPKGDVIQSVHIRNEISRLPTFTRTWDFPPGSTAPAPTPSKPPAPAAPVPAAPAPAAPAPTAPAAPPTTSA